MRILFTCGREPEYTRNEVILRALRRGHHDVVEVSDSHPGSLIARSARLIPRLVYVLARQTFDLVYVGFYGYLLMPVVRQLTNRPIIFDAFVSNYDTLCFDRQQYRPNSLMGRLAYQLDSWACRLANEVVLDTASHKYYFADTYNIPKHKLSHLYVSCNEDMFFPGPVKNKGEVSVFYYSSYMPLHGVEYIVDAAKILESNTTVKLKLAGSGPTYQTVTQLAQRLGVKNVTFEPPIPYKDLPKQIAASDICLAGPFGNTPKAKRVIPGKAFQFLAMARPIIASETAANLELLSHKKNAYLCRGANPTALSASINDLSHNRALRHDLGRTGYETYLNQASEEIVTKKLHNILQKSLL